MKVSVYIIVFRYVSEFFIALSFFFFAFGINWVGLGDIRFCLGCWLFVFFWEVVVFWVV